MTFVPRSVAGTKRRHPLRGGVPPCGVAEARTDIAQTDAAPDALASRLLNCVAPWACAQRQDALAHRIAHAASEGAAVHVARLLDTDALAALGCTSSAALVGALHALQPLGFVRVEGFMVRFFNAMSTCVFVEDVAEQTCTPLEAAHAVHAACVRAGHTPLVQGVYPPTVGAWDAACLSAPPPRAVRSALVVVDVHAAEMLAMRYGWGGRGAAGFRVLSHEAFAARAAAYVAWQRELVHRNVQAAHGRAQGRAQGQGQGQAPASYPRGTLVALAHTPGVDAGHYKAQLARRLPNAIDYVEVQGDAVYVRCADVDAAAALVCLSDALVKRAHTLQGAAEHAYWHKLPARVRAQALRRAARTRMRPV